ncbi:MAG: hypothetical protein QHH07_12885 [Sedimentisphaerales bacterium]|nr:hypothetical protein [Sedimentisphaerales bacterium]
MAAFRAFANKYPDTPAGLQALYDISVMYWNNWRDINTPGEPQDANKVREVAQEIVDKYPDLLDRFVVWSKGKLTYLCPSSPDEHFRNRLAFYRWTLTGIRPEQYTKTIQWMRKV